MYDGDSIIRPAPVADPALPEVASKADSTPEMVRRKITLPGSDPMAFDGFELERRARALRAAAIRSALIGFWAWVKRSTQTARRRRAEEYLARAQSIAELETRLRKLERTGHLLRV
jgi:hypothetical protein